MKMLKLEVLDPRAMRPCGNPFGVKRVKMSGSVASCINIVNTGVKIELPDNMTLMVIPAQTGLTVLGWSMGDEGLKVTVIRDEGNVDFKEPFATVYVVEKKPVSVRFVEFAKEGGRIVCGDAKESHA
jgi:hypothetical protein